MKSVHKLRILEPENHADFEKMCRHIYGYVFKCRTLNLYGRSGQKQYGIDIILQENDIETSEKRIVIQCKHVMKLTFDEKNGDSVFAEVKKLDEGISSGLFNVSKLIIATTAFKGDTTLTNKVKKLSDERVKDGLFAVGIEFWDDIQGHIEDSPELYKRYVNPDRFHERVLEKANHYFGKGLYLAVLDELGKFSDSIAFTQDERVDILNLLSLSSAYRSELDAALNYIDKALSLDPSNHSLFLTKLYILSLGDTTVYDKFVAYLEQENTENVVNEVVVMTAIKKGTQLPEFEELPTGLSLKYNVRLRYLLDANQHHDSIKFQKIYSLLSIDDKDKPEVILLKIHDYLQKFNLKSAIALIEEKFHPRHRKLWNIEHLILRDNIALTLLRVYIDSKNFPNALTLLTEIEHENISFRDKYIYECFQVSFFIKDKDLFDQYKEKYLSNLGFFTTEFLLDLVKIAIYFKDHSLITLILEYASKDLSFEEYEKFQLLYWIEEYRNKPKLLCDAVRKTALIESKSFSTLFVLVKFLLKAKDDCPESFALYNEVIEEVNLFIKEEKFGFYLIPKVYSYFVDTEQYSLAYDLIEQFPDNLFLQEQALFIYLRLGLYIKAKNYLEELRLEDIALSAPLLQNTVFLANQTLDYTLLERVLMAAEKKFELDAYFWRCKLTMLRDSLQYRELRQELRNLPSDILGTKDDLFFIAFLEREFCFVDNALRRIYPLIRNNLDDSSIGVIFLEFMLGLSQPFFLEQKIKEVSLGTVVFYERENGPNDFFALDFSGEYIDNDKFLSLDSISKYQLIGKKVGDTFFHEQFGSVEIFTI